MLRIGPLAALGLAVLLAALGAAGCGSPTEHPLPAACGLFTDAAIKAATGLEPSGEGGGGGPARSTCVWALPNAANGSVSVLLVGCGSGCAGALASLAPSPAYGPADGGLGAGITARSGASAWVIQKGGSVAEIAVTGLGGRTHSALQSLSASAAGRLP